LTLYRDLGFKGASSHSGRRTFITKAAKAVEQLGGTSTSEAGADDWAIGCRDLGEADFASGLRTSMT